MSVTPELAAALVQARSKLSAIAKKSQGQIGKSNYRYADLETVIDHVAPVMSEFGLAIVQGAAPVERGRVGVSTLIVHEGGGVLDLGVIAVPYEQAKGLTLAQSCGRSHTYGRRYMMVAALGLATADDDGRGAGRTPEEIAEEKRETDAKRAEERAAANVQAVMSAVDKMREMSAQWPDDARTATDEICDRLMNGDIDIPDARTEFGALVRRNRS